MSWAKWLVLLVFGLSSLGCSGSAKQIAEESSTLKPLMVLYGRYLGQNRGVPPADEATFKAFVAKQTAEDLSNLGVTDAEKLWVSSRDKEPYVIIYGQVMGPPGPGFSPVVAYERKGVGGKRYVASAMGAVDEVDEAKFKELVPSAAAAP